MQLLCARAPCSSNTYPEKYKRASSTAATAAALPLLLEFVLLLECDLLLECVLLPECVLSDDDAPGFDSGDLESLRISLISPLYNTHVPTPVHITQKCSLQCLDLQI